MDITHSISLHPMPMLHVHYSDRTEAPTVETPREASPKAQRAPNQAAASSSVENGATQFRRDETLSRRVVPSPTNNDVENQSGTFSRPDHDPLKLSSCIKTHDEISNIQSCIAPKSNLVMALSPKKDASKARKVYKFYEDQNENIKRLLKPVGDHRLEAKKESDSNALQYKLAVNGSFVANLALAVLQVYGAVASGSLSLFTTMADALFDPCSNLTLILCNRAVNRVNPRKFPQGKARIETAGNIAFCFLMCAVSFVLIVMSARDIAEGSLKLTSTFHLPSIIAVSVAFVTKLCLFLYCYSLRNKYSQIHILWEDHRNDLIINGVGIMTSILGSKVRWWIDPLGAIALSVLIVTLWLRTALSEFQLLIGVSADTSMLQLITYISMTHSEHVKAIDTVRAWHSGPRLIVEVDIVMDPAMTLRETHDTAEELQTKLEDLPNVDRAYVHVDYETSHAPEHFLKKEL
ncbi:MAG: hypothetical protein M1828_002507 [Chrysothrix sp. TS-e1954]|nr:MAG: hypothetical protein M1828_002507 [Chrysothrix sp. TS-e1954]